MATSFTAPILRLVLLWGSFEVLRVADAARIKGFKYGSSSSTTYCGGQVCTKEEELSDIVIAIVILVMVVLVFFFFVVLPCYKKKRNSTPGAAADKNPNDTDQKPDAEKQPTAHHTTPLGSHADSGEIMNA
ncbi:expressed unknown protein [Seminavis robusta]|uniref:Uncharacterized protein n=1 Tax=Seminavis robusta TaxID=568900 RepID=A0A9N8EI48_9STRA|nr:expressed unknown protein [Seminavis robusta]|eukprot:Sro1230_g254530.1 n/a (131) ;mRNA; f:10987-11379